MPTNADRHRELIASFAAWLEDAFSASVPERIVAFNVNLYDEPFRADIVGSESYDADDADWACAEDWMPHDRFFEFLTSRCSRRSALVTPLAYASDAPSRRFAPDAAAAERRRYLNG